jgi:lipopolysaccharide export system protein LptC
MSRAGAQNKPLKTPHCAPRSINKGSQPAAEPKECARVTMQHDPRLSLEEAWQQRSGDPAALDAAFQRAQRHTSRVRLLKWLLPGAAMVLAGGFAVTVALTRMQGASLESAAIEDGRIVMKNPQMTGVAGDGRGYAVNAGRALQDVANPDSIDLETVTAKVPFGSSATADIDAPAGHFDNAARILTFSQGLNLRTSDGMEARLKDARLDFTTRAMSSSAPVEISTGAATLKAGALSVEDGGGVIRFTGGVRLVIQPKALQPNALQPNALQPKALQPNALQPTALQPQAAGSAPKGAGAASNP